MAIGHFIESFVYYSRIFNIVLYLHISDENKIITVTINIYIKFVVCFYHIIGKYR